MSFQSPEEASAAIQDDPTAKCLSALGREHLMELHFLFLLSGAHQFPPPCPIFSWPEFGKISGKDGEGEFFGKGEETQTSSLVLSKENSSGTGFLPSEARG